MKVNKVIPCGYCKGVINAIALAEKTKINNPNTNIYILGMIVHNKHVVKELEELGIVSLDTTIKSPEEFIDSIDDGIIILTAHGTPKSLKDRIINNGLTLVDATCKDVVKTENIIKQYLNDGYQIIYYGVKNHPESTSAISLSNNVILIEKYEDINKIDLDKKSIFISQTTMSSNLSVSLYNMIKMKMNNLTFVSGICDATDSRQNAIKMLKDCDVLYIIGDKTSNNTNKLYEVAKECNIKKVFLIDNKDEINKNDLTKNDIVYVTAGASTPPKLINDAIDYLNSIF